MGQQESVDRLPIRKNLMAAAKCAIDLVDHFATDMTAKKQVPVAYTTLKLAKRSPAPVSVKILYQSVVSVTGIQNDCHCQYKAKED
jgi:hypothetical protein